jgi:heptose I phosphotransferase
VAELYLRDELAAAWRGLDPFQVVAALEGEVYREVAGRRTLRVLVDERPYFLKFHSGVGWGEILKNLLSLRRPVIGAANEYRACRQLEELDIAAPRVAAYGARGWNPATRESFILCDPIEDAPSLETLTENWHVQAPDGLQVRRLVMALARLARRFHAAGFVHRDFYLCHFLVDADGLARGEVQLSVIDLHRARRFRRLPRRWRKRDLAALFYSSLDLPLSQRAWLRFVRVYADRPLREVRSADGVLWGGVVSRARALYRKGMRKGLVQGRSPL